MSERKPIANMPGPGGSLGMCAVCGETFLKEILLGEMVQIMGLEGMDKDFCVHAECQEKLAPAIASKKWTDLPEGPLRKAFGEQAKSGAEGTS